MRRGFSQIVIMTVVVGILVGVGATFAYFKFKPKPAPQPPPVSQSSPISKLSPSPAVSPDETANWRTYTGSGYSFKYPTSFEDRNGVLTYYSSTVKTGPGVELPTWNQE